MVTICYPSFPKALENRLCASKVGIAAAGHQKTTAEPQSRLPLKHVPSKHRVRPHSNNTSKQYDIRITRGWMKTLAIRSDFDLSFQDLGF